jgi:hypothetical protein
MSPSEGARQGQFAPVSKEQNHGRRNADERHLDRDALHGGLYVLATAALAASAKRY